MLMNQEYYNISKRIIKKYLEYLGNILDIEIKRLVHDERARYNLQISTHIVKKLSQEATDNDKGSLAIKRCDGEISPRTWQTVTRNRGTRAERWERIASQSDVKERAKPGWTRTARHETRRKHGIGARARRIESVEWKVEEGNGSAAPERRPRSLAPSPKRDDRKPKVH